MKRCLLCNQPPSVSYCPPQPGTLRFTLPASLAPYPLQADTQTATATATGGSGPLVDDGETFSYTEGSVNTEAGGSFVSEGQLEASGLPQSFAVVNAQNVSP